MTDRAASILLVEDDQSLLAGLRTFFDDHGFTTHAATTKADAQRLLRLLRPQVCVLDLNLPDGSGLDVLRTILHERLPVKAIVMSALPQDRLRQQFPTTVLAALMTKPVSPQDLLDLVNRTVT